jgi:hypothetical protein
MSGFIVDDRVRMAIELALTATRTDDRMRSEQEDRARLLGLCGAEIDAARNARSFDVLTSLAISLATAKGDRRACARDMAMKAGITAESCREIEDHAAQTINMRWRHGSLAGDADIREGGRDR